jgi:hypothetical protein
MVLSIFFLMRILVAISTACAVGLHWILLQSVAWLGMVVIYTQQEASLLEGLSKTFDGAHPCALCLAIREVQNREGGKHLPGTPLARMEIKITMLFAEVDAWNLPELPPSDPRYPAWRLGSPVTLSVSPLEKPPRWA